MVNPQPHKARKRFGQNFLTDDNIIRRIVQSIRPRAEDNIVEIGPGKGAITALLLAECPKLNVVELDKDLIPVLLSRFIADYPGFKIHQQDALKFDFSQLTDADSKLRVVGNLPYNISTPLIFHLLSFTGCVKDMHFMLQNEVVNRMTAQPGQKAYGRLSVMVQYFCETEKLFDVPPDAFDPKPKVDSAIIRLQPHRSLPHPAADVRVLEKLVNVAFQQRRKTIRNALKQLVDPELLEQLPVDLKLRPENISLEEFVTISDLLVQHHSGSK